MWSEEKLMPKLVTYNLFKDSRDCEPYLKINIPRRLVITFARFRTGSHNLEIEVGRHHTLAREDRLCKFCRDNKNIAVVEDEYHVLIECHYYNDIRILYIENNCS